MKIGRQSNSAHSNDELLHICDYAMDEDVHVQVSMEDIERLDVVQWQWDVKTKTPWVLVEDLRAAVASDELKKRIKLP